jgi:aminopeptidase N
LEVALERPVPPEVALQLTVRYSGHPRPVVGRWGEVGWQELADGVLVAAQPDGARSWFPCNDSPEGKSRFRFTVSTESAYSVICNGHLTSKQDHGGRTTWTYDVPEPMAPYLATAHIGHYRLVNASSRPVPQLIAAPDRLVPRVKAALGRQGEMMTLFQRMFGPFPFGSYTVVVTEDELEIPVEAQGVSVFGANHVDTRPRSERLVAHELAHQWFGNSLTLTRWRDIWLHEGFARYAEWLWSEFSGRESTHALARRAAKRLKALPQDLVLADPGPDCLFDDRVYQRGALTLQALRATIGDRAFFALLRAWTAAHRHGGVSTDQFTALAQRHTDHLLDGLFGAWLHERPMPELP